MVGLAFAIAASANFPVLLLSMLWKGLTTRGAFIGGFVGLISAVVLTIYSPGIWEAVLGNPKGGALVPSTRRRRCSPCRWRSSAAGSFRSPKFGISAAKERAAFDAQYVRSQTGVGAEGARFALTRATKDEKMGVQPSGSGALFLRAARRPAPPSAIRRERLRKATLDLSIEVARIRFGQSGAE